MSNDLSTAQNGNGAGFRVLRLQAANVKRLRAVDITPDPEAPLILIGGKNGAGKSSALDAIMYALAGKEAVCAEPIRHGQKKAHVTLDLGDYIVTRRFTPTGQTLEFKTKAGANVPSPQSVLDRMAGVLNFDPLEFSRMAPAKRLATLMSLVHLDINLDEIAAKRKELYDKRRDIRRLHDDFAGDLRQTPEPDASLPREKVDVSALIERKNELVWNRDRNTAKRTELVEAQSAVRATIRRIEDLDKQIEALQRQRDARVAERDDYVATVERLQKQVDALVDPDFSEIDAQIAAAADLNTRIDRAAQYRERAAKVATLAAQVEAISEEIEQLDQTKEEALEKAEFPIPGLAFSDGDVCYNGTLYDQLSSAEQVKVSLAMAMAMNPQLRVILIKDGSLLDETSLKIIREMAAERGYQVWIEVVGNRQDATVIIEDGAVVGADEPETAEAVGANA